MSIVIIFNAPPQSGKDTVVEIIERENRQHGLYKSLHHLSFKEALIDKVLAFFDIDRDTWDEHYTSQGKELPRDWLGGMSQREALIWMSEEVVKPKFGKEFFGKEVAKNINPEGDHIYLFSDGGFNEEVMPIIDLVGAENVFIVYVHRDGHTFENDSRNYINVECIPDFNFQHVFNTGSLEDLREEVVDFLDFLLETGAMPTSYLNTH